MWPEACLSKLLDPKVTLITLGIWQISVSRENNDLGFLTFDLKTVLNRLFNRLVKQLFLYRTAESQTEQKELNQMVLWDKIILRGENAPLDFKNMITRYYFWDDGNGFRDHQNVTTTLTWNIVPNVGLLPNVFAHGHHSFKFSETLCRRRLGYGDTSGPTEYRS
ncbi:signal peptidase complex subunit 3-like [Uranotaenia lowii]|uniref:signal peptidase complex subunit 3-like n=1 Tax=Uranotaenia lowii TaxID=190385 RepID=UPI00247B1983|nr:signal peptidase complex subunit 3-like [Uranotaenia lowii]